MAALATMAINCSNLVFINSEKTKDVNSIEHEHKNGLIMFPKILLGEIEKNFRVNISERIICSIMQKHLT